MVWRVCGLMVALCSVGCGASLGKFDAHGFVHGTYPYTVDYNDAQAKTFVNRDWRIENFYPKADHLEPKTGDDYETTYKLDTDGDGEYESSVDGFVYDLKLEHTRREQVLWLRTLPISLTDRDKNLDVLMRQYIEGIAGAGVAVVSLKKDAVEIKEKRFATQILGSQAARVADREALLVVIDVANVDQLSLTPSDRKQRVALLFVRSGYQFWLPGKNQVPVGFPVLLVAGYASHPNDFEQGLVAFEYMMSKVTLHQLPGVGPANAAKRTPEAVRQLPGVRASLSVRRMVAPMLLPAPTAPTAPTAPATPISPAPETPTAVLPTPAPNTSQSLL